MDIEEKRTLLITGFGPFRNYIVNPSWEAVKELIELSTDLELNYNINIVSHQASVTYQYVSNYIPKLWNEHKPMFVIHVGVSDAAECLQIECKAHSSGYDKPDINNEYPNDNEISQVILQPTIDVQKICDVVNNNSTKSGCNALISDNAGRYLCEYIFYQSLNINPARVLFVHVPDSKLYSPKQVAKGLYDIVCYLLKCENKNS